MIGVTLHHVLLAGQILAVLLMAVVSAYAIKTAFPIWPMTGDRRDSGGFFSLQECNPATGCQAISDRYLVAFVALIIFGSIVKLRPVLQPIFGPTWPFLPVSMAVASWVIYAVIL
jgi:hypothetical protein